MSCLKCGADSFTEYCDDCICRRAIQDNYEYIQDKLTNSKILFYNEIFNILEIDPTNRSLVGVLKEEFPDICHINAMEIEIDNCWDNYGAVFVREELKFEDIEEEIRKHYK